MTKKFCIMSEQEKNEIIMYLSSGKYPENLNKYQKRNLRRKSELLFLRNNILYIKENTVEKIFICVYENDKKKSLIINSHNEDHAGIRTTFDRIKSFAYGITLKDVGRVLNRCENCIRERPPQICRGVNPIVPNYPRERLIVDTIDMRMYSDHNDEFKYIFTFIDSFTKFGWAYKSKKKDAESFSKILLNHFYEEGLWTIFHSDNGREFVNSKVTEILKKFNIRSVHGMPYHPQSQGQVERFNRTLKERLRKSMPIGCFNWINHIDKVVFLYNNTNHRATRCKPFVLFKGFDIDLFSNNSFNDNNNIAIVRSRIMDYIDSFRREYIMRQYDEISLFSIVIVARSYNFNKLRRRHTFESLYYPNNFLVVDIESDSVKIRDTITGDEKVVSRRQIKLISNTE
ncbi:Pro-Pol polyprotein [Dictyocoela muelleri]|nr:Pro-Pol polyprotein [Dictyocoela muelleri]